MSSNSTPTKSQRRFAYGFVSSLGSSDVMSIAHGAWLETFLNKVSGRHPSQASTRPAFLNNPALCLEDSPQGNETFPLPMPRTSESSGNSPLPSFDRAPTQNRDGPGSINPMQYRDLPEEAMALDKALFNIIATIVKGSYLALCIDLTGENARSVHIRHHGDVQALARRTHRKQPRNCCHDPPQVSRGPRQVETQVYCPML